jgi:hypothetical protein
MSTDHDETRIRRLFAAMRERDAASAPAFDTLVRRLAPQAPAVWLRAAVAAALVALCIGLALAAARRRAGLELAAWSSLSNWKPSSDSLVSLSTTPWDEAASTPTDAWIRGETTRSEEMQTNEREMP